MVDWLAGNRVRGTSTERTTSTGFNDGFTGTGGWKELARTTLGSAGDDIDVTGLADKRYLMVLIDEQSSGETYGRMRFNADTGNNYATRYSSNGGSDSTLTSFGSCVNYPPPVSNQVAFSVNYITNKSDKEKLVITPDSVGSNTSGAGNAPQRRECVSKWTNTSSVISQVNIENGTSGDFTSGSECVVLGWDDSDTHTTNFWEELADVTLGSSATTLSTGTFTAKKYLWFQTYMKSGNCDYRLTFNGDSGSNYATRWSENGGSDVTSTSTAFNYLSPQGASTPRFTNTFMINNSANEKLGISHVALQNTAGAGTAPERDEVVHKWANTSAQITSLTVAASINTLSAGTQIKVWGSD